VRSFFLKAYADDRFDAQSWPVLRPGEFEIPAGGGAVGRQWRGSAHIRHFAESNQQAFFMSGKRAARVFSTFIGRMRQGSSPRRNVHSSGDLQNVACHFTTPQKSPAQVRAGRCRKVREIRETRFASKIQDGGSLSVPTIGPKICRGLSTFQESRMRFHPGAQVRRCRPARRRLVGGSAH